MQKIFRTGIGQDSHRFEKKIYPCILAGLEISQVPKLSADSDGDVVFHALCNAVTSLTSVPMLGGEAVELCKKGVKDSSVYVQKALAALKNQKIVHAAFSLEAKRPRLENLIPAMRKNIADLLHVQFNQVGMTVTSGDGLTSFGKGEGIQCFCLLTTEEQI